MLYIYILHYTCTYKRMIERERDHECHFLEVRRDSGSVFLMNQSTENKNIIHWNIIHRWSEYNPFVNFRIKIIHWKQNVENSLGHLSDRLWFIHVYCMWGCPQLHRSAPQLVIGASASPCRAPPPRFAEPWWNQAGPGKRMESDHPNMKHIKTCNTIHMWKQSISTYTHIHMHIYHVSIYTIIQLYIHFIIYI